MKKSIKTLTFGLLTVGMLAGCNKPAPVADWTAEQKSIMSEHLHGVVLPFFKSDATVKYESQYDEVVITADVAGTETKDYGAKFTAADGWEDITDQYNVPAAAMRETFFAFQRAVTVTEGTRYISLQFASMVGQEFSAEGKFTLYANDPFTYDWPADEWAEVIAHYFEDATDVVPPIQADRYEPYAPQSGGFATFCYMESTTQDAGYSAILTQAGWDVQEEKDEDGYFVAVAPSGLFAVAYLYVSSMGSLNIWLAPAPAKTYDAFPSEALAATIAAYAEDGAVAFEFPVFAKEGAKFTYEEDELNDMYIDYGLPEYAGAIITAAPVVEDDYTAYKAAFVTASWTVEDAARGTGFTATKDIEDVGTASIDVSYADGEIEITVYIIPKPFPAAEWPAEEVAAYLASEDVKTDSLPAADFEGASYNFFTVFGAGVTVIVAEEEVANAMAAYGAALLEAHFTYDEESKTYTSPNGEFYVTITEGIDGGFDINISFPKTLKRMMKSNNENNYPLPDFSALEDKVVWANTGFIDYYILQIVFTGDVVEQVITAIGSAQGWSVPETPSDQYGYECMYGEELLEMDVKYYESNDMTVIQFYNWE